MTTLRVAKRNRWTSVDRKVINDERLSFGALGLLIWLLDKPDDWETSSERIAGQRKEGRDAVRTIFKELEKFGYLVRVTWRDERGHMNTRLDFFEQPQTTEDVGKSQVAPETAFPASGEPASGEPASDTPSSIEKTERQTTEKQKTDVKTLVVASDNEKNPLTDEHYRLASLFADKVEANGAKRPSTGVRAARSIEMMMRVDGRSARQIENMIGWATSHEFWHTVVLSCNKLRLQYDQMKLKADAERKRPTSSKQNVSADGRMTQSEVNLENLARRKGFIS